MKTVSGELNSKLIIKYLMRKTGLGQQALGERLFPGQSEPRKKIQRWLSGAGISAVNRNSIEALFPETSCLFDLPLDSLLSVKALSTTEIDGLLSPYKNNRASGVFWALPERSLLNPNSARPIFGRSNSQALAETGSVQGFAIILGLVLTERLKPKATAIESKIKRSAGIYYHLIQAARAFPNVARHPIFADEWKILYDRFKEFWLASLPDPTVMALDDELMGKYISMESEYVLWRGGYGRVSGQEHLIVLPPPVTTFADTGFGF